MRKTGFPSHVADVRHLVFSIYGNVILKRQRIANPAANTVATAAANILTRAITGAAPKPGEDGGNPHLAMQHLCTSIFGRRRVAYGHVDPYGDASIEDIVGSSAGAADVVILFLQHRTVIPNRAHAFTLDGGVLNVSDTAGELNHAVACLLCAGVPYVYDSNNIIVSTDWPNAKFDAYERLVASSWMDAGMSAPDPAHSYLSVAVYVA